MNIKSVNDALSVSAQISVDDVATIKARGFKSIICNRPDNEQENQVNFDAIEQAAIEAGLSCYFQPVVSGKVTQDDAERFAEITDTLPKPALAYCRTGTRSITLWSLANVNSLGLPTVLQHAEAAGYDPSVIAKAFNVLGIDLVKEANFNHQIVIVGGGAAGIAVASSIIKRSAYVDIAIIDPAEHHFYQPGWTMVGGGVFSADSTKRDMDSVIPESVHHIHNGVASFLPDQDLLILNNGKVVHYQKLIVCPGLVLDWQKIEGLEETLGKNNVSSNYRYDLAPYTWDLVKNFKGGRAIFTQPPMPIKCAGAPQKAMYLSCDHWLKTGALKNIDVQFFNAGGVLFGVNDYVPALMEYVERYNANLNFSHELIKVDGEAKTATFRQTLGDEVKEITEHFDMLHVVPPQSAPSFIKRSALADDAGWLDVDQFSLQHKRFANVYGIGDVINTPNAKTAAAARAQAPVVAHNVLNDMDLMNGRLHYNGYGSCPLVVERGKIVLAEFGYGGKVLQSFPKWMLDGTKATSLAWILKKDILPVLYWNAMLKGREWMIKTTKVE